jgi:hypothetical protein
VDKDADIIFGASVDPSMNNEVSITVLATGFDMKEKAETISSFRQTSSNSDSSAEVTSESGNTPLYFDRSSKTSPSFRAVRGRESRRGILGYLRGLFQ